MVVVPGGDGDVDVGHRLSALFLGRLGLIPQGIHFRQAGVARLLSARGEGALDGGKAALEFGIGGAQDAFGIGVKEIQVFNTTKTSLDAIRALVNQYRTGGQVTKEGATRLLSKLDRAQAELNKGSTAGAIRNLQQFIDDTALLEVYVPGEEARNVLVDEAQQMISQLGGTPSPA